MATKMNEHSRIQARSRITSKGQTTVPKEVRDALSLDQGAQIEWVVEQDRMTAIVKPRTLRAVDLVGYLGVPPSGRRATVDQISAETRAGANSRYRKSIR